MLEPWLVVMLHTPRVLAAALLIPLLGAPLVPAPVTSVFALAIGAFASMSLGSAGVPATPGSLLFALALKEAGIGAALGFAFATVLRLGQSIGQFIDHHWSPTPPIKMSSKTC